VRMQIVSSKDIEQCPIRSLEAGHFYVGGGCRCTRFHLLVQIKAELDPRVTDEDLEQPTVDALMTRIHAQVQDQEGLIRYQITDNLPTLEQPMPLPGDQRDDLPKEER
jgi:hypothetical protein